MMHLRAAAIGLALATATSGHAAERPDFLVINFMEEGRSEYKYKILADQAFNARIATADFTCGVKSDGKSLNLMISVSDDRSVAHVKVALVDDRTRQLFETESTARSLQTISVNAKGSIRSSEPFRTSFINIQNAELTSLGRELDLINDAPIVQEPSGQESAFEFGCWWWPKQ